MSASVEAMNVPLGFVGEAIEGTPRIRHHEFQQLRVLIAQLSGIDLGEHKKGLVVGRLGRRLRELGMHSFEEYYHRLCERNNSDERQTLLNLITTNETYFFREERHFSYLQQHLLPSMSQVGELRVWSAACSSGEEVYSLAMLIDDFRHGRGYHILGTDISERVLKKAQQAIYPMESVVRIPRKYLQEYCLQGVREQAGNLRVVRHIRNHVQFKKLNLNEHWPDVGRFHVIFLRNVMIYFSQETKRELIHKLSQQLHPGGYLIIGLSESLNGMSERFNVMAPSIYRLKN